MSEPPEHYSTFNLPEKSLVRAIWIIPFLIALIGSSVAFFLWSLDSMIALFATYPYLVYALPIVGLLTGWLYETFGKNCHSGNNQVYQEIRHSLFDQQSTHDSLAQNDGDNSPASNKPTPLIMAPLVLLGTLLTHLCGGSAGREGTAIQIGGAIASWLSRIWKSANADRAMIIQGGVAAGFGAVFGTPLAAAIFAIEVLGLRFARWRSIPFCLVCAIGADLVTQFWGIRHTEYSIDPMNIGAPSLPLLFKLMIAGLAFGAIAMLFLNATKLVSRLFERFVPRRALQPAIGGLLIVTISLTWNVRDYLGLGVVANSQTPQAVSIVSSFQVDGANSLSWLSKLALTSITVGSGLKGGEATPLFFVGSTLGNTLSGTLNLPVDLLAGLGFVAVFAAATRTPLACSMMAIELFHRTGSESFLLAFYALLCCSVASLFGIAVDRIHSAKPH